MASAASVIPAAGAVVSPTNVDWAVYRGGPVPTDNAELAQMNAANVHRLRAGLALPHGDAIERSTMHANPLVVDGATYVTTPGMKAVALDACSPGRELWVFDPAPHNHGEVSSGCATAESPIGRERKASASFTSCVNASMRSMRKPAFGRGGHIDLKENLGVDPARVFIEMTSPGAIYKNFLILGSRVNESYDASPGTHPRLRQR